MIEIEAHRISAMKDNEPISQVVPRATNNSDETTWRQNMKSGRVQGRLEEEEGILKGILKVNLEGRELKSR